MLIGFFLLAQIVLEIVQIIQVAQVILLGDEDDEVEVEDDENNIFFN